MIKIYGASDDLIEIEGDISEEFTAYLEDNTQYVACSDGTLLAVRYGDQGVWRLSPVYTGPLFLRVEQCTSGETDCDSDVAYMDAGIRWIALAEHFVK